MQITAHQEQFIKFCLESKVLAFGDFTLKSGLKSHYFFNAGLFNTNKAIALLGEFYAKEIYDSIIQRDKLHFDCLFGPAYKGITLAGCASIGLYNKYHYETDIAFNRKETKTHGEGGNLIGADVTNKKVLLIDDVISAGTATRESINILQPYNATVVGIVIAMDRKTILDKDKQLTAAQLLTAEFNIPVYSIINVNDVITFTATNPEYHHIYKNFMSN